MTSFFVEFVTTLSDLSFTVLFVFDGPFFSDFLSTIVTDFSFALSSIVLTLLSVGFSGLSFGFSSVLDLSLDFKLDFVNLGFASGAEALSACFAAEGLTSLSSTGAEIPFSDFSGFSGLSDLSLTVACFFKTAAKKNRKSCYLSTQKSIYL